MLGGARRFFVVARDAFAALELHQHIVRTQADQIDLLRALLDRLALRLAAAEGCIGLVTSGTRGINMVPTRGAVPVLGTNNIERIRTAADALRVTMDRQTWFELYTLAIGKEVA